MYAPEGFTPFSMICGIFDEAEDLYLENDAVWNASNFLDEALGLGDELESDFEQFVFMRFGFGELSRSGRFSTAFRAWVIDSYLQKIPVFVCSPGGVVLQIDNQLCESALGLFRNYWRVHYFPSVRIQFIVGEILYEEKSDKILTTEAFPFFDVYTGIIDNLFDTAAVVQGGIDPPKLNFYRQAAARLEGYAICLRQADVPKDVHKLLDLVGIDFLNGHSNNESMNKSGLRNVYSSMLEAYPNGKTQSWPLTEAKVGYSRRQMLRALSVHDPIRGWADTGQ